MANENAEPNGAPNPFVPTRRSPRRPPWKGPRPSPRPLYPAARPHARRARRQRRSPPTEQAANAPPATGPGVEGEEIVWEASYSMRNFMGRIAFRIILTIAWIALAVETWGRATNNMAPVTIVLGIGLVVFWLMLLYRMAQARYGHYYRLTNRRLFVSTGLMRRRRDQMELLRVKDVYTRQTLTERWMSLGTVIVVSSEKELPIFYITGVSDPKQVMDLIWNAARTERDVRSTNIHSV